VIGAGCTTSKDVDVISDYIKKFMTAMKKDFKQE
jgi:hypothetical protein